MLKFVLRHKWLSVSVSIGWVSRTQFEETWATLLGVLVTQPIVMDQEENQQEVTSFTEFLKLSFNSTKNKLKKKVSINKP